MSEPRHLLECPDRSNVGRRLTLKPGGGFEALLDVRGDDAAARAVTVALSIAPTVQVARLGPDDLLAGRDELRARALIEAGVGGHTVKLELDVGAGVHFGASVSSLRVSAINDGGAPVHVGAYVGYGQSGAQPALTVYGARLAPLARWVLNVPPFARAVEVLRPAERGLLVEIARGRAGDRWLYGDRLVAGQRMRPLPIANGCRRVRLTNLSTDGLSPVVLFSLAL